MNMLTQLFDPLQRAAVAFFKHDVALRRTGGSVHIVLEQRGGPPPKPTRQELALRKQEEELALAMRQLGDLLAGLPGRRRAMRHLVLVEQALGERGFGALHTLPIDVLRHALSQLEGLVTNWSPEGLANVRSKMAVAIIDRRHAGVSAEGDASPTAAVLDAGSSQLPCLPEVSDFASEDEDALAAAYAALSLAPATPATPAIQAELQATI